MTPDVALAAGVQAWWLKASLTMWLTVAGLLLVDRRPAIAIPCLLLALAAGSSSLAAWKDAEGWARGMWLASILAALMVAVGCLRDWLAGRTASRWLFPVVGVVAIASGWGLMIALAAAAPLSPRANVALAIAHLASVSTALAVCVASGIEATFLSLPTRLTPTVGGDGTTSRRAEAAGPTRRPRWGGLVVMAVAAWITQAVLAGFVFASPMPSEPSDSGEPLLARMFSITLLVAGLTAAWVPRRLAVGQAAGRGDGWVSLVFAAWLAALSFAVALALPGHWPWSKL